MLLVVKKATQESGSKFELLGFAAVHNFYHYPESIRLRISQVGPRTALLSVYIVYGGCTVFSQFLRSYSMALLGSFCFCTHGQSVFLDVKLTLTELHNHIFWKVKHTFCLARCLYDFVVFFRYLCCHLIRVKAMVLVFLKQSIILHSLRTFTMLQ